jgi:hypothetical protein
MGVAGGYLASFHLSYVFLTRYAKIAPKATCLILPGLGEVTALSLGVLKTNNIPRYGRSPDIPKPVGCCVVKT